MTISKELDGIKMRIDSAKTDYAKAKGALDEILSRMKKEFNIDTLEDAEEEIKAMKQELEELETDLESKIEKFKAKYQL